ncbi:lipase domain-containing protein [Phthorimaea operculella]|nr:lipase domain-containing protein [Phthorimaea operculella]
MYIWFTKAVCSALSDPRKAKEIDILELQETVSVVLLDGDEAIWYPIYSCIVPVQHNSIKESLKIINISLNANESANNSYPSDNSFPWNPTSVKLGVRRHKRVPVNEFLVHHRRRNMTEWHPVNESSLHINIQMPLKVNWYSLNEPQNKLKFNTKFYQSFVHKNNKKTTWRPIKLFESYIDQEDRDAFIKVTSQGENIRKNWYWYLVNETHVAVKEPDINITRETKFIIHGFGGSAFHPVTKNIAMAFHKLNKFNVLVLDAKVVLDKGYFDCVKNARLVGKAIAELISHLVSFGAKSADFHLIGVSLGAQVAGWAGKYYLHAEGCHLGRITALDPAGPCFANSAPRDRTLDKTDALYLDVIHSNVLLEGLFEPLGHADFYINGGGPFQPGCFLMKCSHLLASYVYTESISRPELFVAVKCDSWTQFLDEQCTNQTAILGNAPLPDTRGMYYLRTSGETPYGIGRDGTRPLKW